jgi:hypothetical protein
MNPLPGRARKQAVSPHSRGQAAIEFVLVYSLILLPVTMMVIFTSQMLWVWNSMVEFTREGARYAATHCWQPGGENVLSYMRENVPLTVDMEQFQSGEVEIMVEYFARDPESGNFTEYSCDGSECSAECVPDAVRVRITNYEYRKFFSYLGLPGVRAPEFATILPIESAGCDPEQGTCLP